jgi:hypothetical protein
LAAANAAWLGSVKEEMRKSNAAMERHVQELLKKEEAFALQQEEEWLELERERSRKGSSLNEKRAQEFERLVL